MDLYSKVSTETARIVTKQYSSSFYISSTLLEKETRDAIFAIYGFVRFADEIVDTFHNFDKEHLLLKFESDLKDAVNERISMNPILNAFQGVVHDYNIPEELTDAFLQSMKTDLSKQVYASKEETENYIYGSANVVGLMCLKVFTRDNDQAYEALKTPAMMLGSAFQKVNFLRDLRTDIQELNRIYFSEYDFDTFGEEGKAAIVKEIRSEFDNAKKGIALLPGRSKLAVLTAYCYYRRLLEKIACAPADKIMETRIRVSSFTKIVLLIKAMIMYKLKII